MDLREASHDASAWRLLAGEVFSKVDEGSYLTERRAFIPQGVDALTGGELPFGVDAVYVFLSPACVDHRPSLFEEIDPLGRSAGVELEAGLTQEVAAVAADGLEGDFGHDVPEDGSLMSRGYQGESSGTLR